MLNYKHLGILSVVLFAGIIIGAVIGLSANSLILLSVVLGVGGGSVYLSFNK
jgi:hypothetical protein